jgi:hypothetical protein
MRKTRKTEKDRREGLLERNNNLAIDGIGWIASGQ